MATRKRAGKRRVQQRIRKIPISNTIPLGVLATKDALVQATLNAGDTEFVVMSLEGTWFWDSAAAGDGPISVGFAAPGYTAAQVEEAIEAAGAIDIGNPVAQEQANRLVRTVGTCSDVRPSLQDGRIIKTKLNWRIAIGDQLQVFVYNQEGGPLVTGSAVLFQGHAWIRFL